LINNSDDLPRVQALPYFHLNRALNDYDRTHNLQITSIWEAPFGKGRRWLNSGGALSAIAGGWQLNSLLSFMSGTPFSIDASGDALDLPGSTQRADQLKRDVKIYGDVGPDKPYFDVTAYRDVTEPRFGTSSFNSLRGPGLANWDFGLFREFRLTERYHLQFRMESFNFTNTPHFANPGADVSNLSLDPSGAIRDLGGFGTISSTTNLAREGIDERQFRFGLRFSF
jgi:hypothetical protein